MWIERGQLILSSAPLSPDGKKLVAKSPEGTVSIWDAELATELQRVPHRPVALPPVNRDGVLRLSFPNGLVMSASFSPDGKKVIAAREGTTVQIWNVESGEELQKLTGHPNYVNFAAFSPDGKKIVAVGDGGLARIWTLE